MSDFTQMSEKEVHDFLRKKEIFRVLGPVLVNPYALLVTEVVSCSKGFSKRIVVLDDSALPGHLEFGLPIFLTEDPRELGGLGHVWYTKSKIEVLTRDHILWNLVRLRLRTIW